VTPQPVMGDRGQMQQVVLNPVVNGIEAMTASTHRPRVLRVSSRMAGPGNVSIAVVDTGTGLDTTKVDHIFDAFFTTKPERDGNEVVDLPLDCRSAWWPAVGVAKFDSGEHLSVHCAGGGQPALRSGKLNDSAR
jgi:hypothetical protein